MIGDTDSTNEPPSVLDATPAAQPDSVANAEADGGAVATTGLSERTGCEASSLPEQLTPVGLPTGNELSGAASTSAAIAEKPFTSNSTPKRQIGNGEASHGKSGSKVRGRQKGKSDRGRSESLVPKEVDAEGQKLLEACEHFRENAYDRLHYFE